MTGAPPTGPTVALLVAVVVGVWLATLLVHELGHVAAAWLTGGQIVALELRPGRLPLTLVRPNPAPAVVRWGGFASSWLLPPPRSGTSRERPIISVMFVFGRFRPLLGAPRVTEPIRVRRADLHAPADGEALVALLDAYARDPMGGGQPLAPDVRERLLAGLREHPTTLVFLAFLADRPVGVATGFVGFSTFAARPLVNVHDLGVLPEARSRGVGRALLAAVERHARGIGCCRLTLEVLKTNTPARSLYESLGFGNTPPGFQDTALFYAKPL